MATEVTKVIDPDMGSGYDYDSLYDWEAAQQGDLTGARNEIAVAKCRCTGGTADTTAVTIDGWTTSATQYVKIWTDPAESYRHAGKWEVGNKYRLSVQVSWSVVYSIDIVEQYVKIDGLQIEFLDTGGYTFTGPIRNAGNETAQNVIISNCVIRKKPGSGYCGSGITTNAYYGRIKSINNIIYDHGNAGIYCYDGSTGTTGYFYNNTIHNCAAGISLGANNRAVAYNNLIKSCTTPATGTFNAGSGYNATNNGSIGYTVTGGAVGDRTGQTFTFVDEANDDFHLASNDAGALGYGTNLYNDANFPFQDDIDGQDRGGSGAQWDIGADEYVSSVIVGLTCWGHSTGVTQDNVLNLSTWTGTGTVSGTGDAEKLSLWPGQYMESPAVQISGTVTLDQNAYGSGSDVTLKYRTAATEGGLAGESWSTYSAPITSSGYIQVRLERSGSITPITFGVATAAGTTSGFGWAGNGTITVTLPTSWAQGQLGIIPCYLDQGTASIDQSWQTLTGSPFGAGTQKLYIFYKFLGASETNPTITISGSTGTLASSAACATFAGVDTTTPIEVVGSPSNGTGTPNTAGEITTLTAGAWVLGIAGRGDNEAYSGQSFGGSTTGVSERLDAGSSAGDDSQVCIYSKEIAAAGATGNGSATTSATDPWVSVLVALRRVQDILYVEDVVVDLGAQTETKTVSLDSLVQKALTRAASLDAYLQKSVPITLSLDALLQILGTRSAALDALLTSTGLTRTASLDALLNRAGITASHSLDALINKAGLTAATGIDALLIQAATYSLTAPLDALINRAGMVAALSLDALAQKAQALATALDAYLQATGQTPASLDAMVQIMEARTTALDACLNATGLTRAASLDAFLNAVGLTRSASIDACLNRSGMGAATVIDALLMQLGLTRATSIDALVNAAGLASTASIDACLNQTGRTAGTALDAVLYSLASGQVGTALDALLNQVGLTRSASIDALVSIAEVLPAALDAVIARAMVQSLSLDALAQRSGLTSTAQLDAWLYALRTIAPQLDAVIAKTFGPQIGLDAILSGAGTYQLISLDALLARGEIRLASLDAIVYGELTHAVNMDGLLQRPDAAAVTLLDAIVYSALAAAFSKARFMAVVGRTEMAVRERRAVFGASPPPTFAAKKTRAACAARVPRPAFAAA